MWCESINELDPYKAVIDDRKTDWQRGKLVHLLIMADYIASFRRVNRNEFIADYLLAHGVSVVPGKVREAKF